MVGPHRRSADGAFFNLRGRIVALGGFFFRYRSYTALIWFILLALCTFKEGRDIFTWLPGTVLLFVGEAVRIWSVAVIGKESRTRGSGVSRLVTQGPYAYVRNPLYIGNFLILLGATLISELCWLLPIAVLLFAVQYVPIVLWEEGNIRNRFGEEFSAYCRRVPRWIPRWHSVGRASKPYQWRAAFWSERSTFATLALLLLVMLMKENAAHIPKYLHKHWHIIRDAGSR